MDIYIDMPHNNKIWIIDFGPWSVITNPILFEWDELNNVNLTEKFELNEN